MYIQTHTNTNTNLSLCINHFFQYLSLRTTSNTQSRLEISIVKLTFLPFVPFLNFSLSRSPLSFAVSLLFQSSCSTCYFIFSFKLFLWHFHRLILPPVELAMPTPSYLIMPHHVVYMHTRSVVWARFLPSYGLMYCIVYKDWTT